MDADNLKDVAKELKDEVEKIGFWPKVLILAVFLFMLSAVGSFVFWVTCVDFVDNYEIGYRYDTFGANAGEIHILPRTGYFATWPFRTKIHTIDGRPMQVCISAINRVLNCKLVQFNPEGIDIFLEWHGRNNYTNTGSMPGHPTQFNEILMNYAYDGSGKSYPFLTLLRELKADDGPKSTEARK